MLCGICVNCINHIYYCVEYKGCRPLIHGTCVINIIFMYIRFLSWRTNSCFGQFRENSGRIRTIFLRKLHKCYSLAPLVLAFVHGSSFLGMRHKNCSDREPPCLMNVYKSFPKTFSDLHECCEVLKNAFRRTTTKSTTIHHNDSRIKELKLFVGVSFRCKWMFGVQGQDYLYAEFLVPFVPEREWSEKLKFISQTAVKKRIYGENIL